MLTEKALVRQFMIGNLLDLFTTEFGISTQRAIELNPLDYNERTILLKFVAVGTLILLYALTKTSDHRWSKPVEHGLQLGTLFVWLAVLNNTIIIAQA